MSFAAGFSLPLIRIQVHTKNIQVICFKSSRYFKGICKDFVKMLFSQLSYIFDSKLNQLLQAGKGLPILGLHGSQRKTH